MPQRGYVSQPRVGRGTRPTLGSMLERISTPTGLCPAGEAVDGGTQPRWGRGHAGCGFPLARSEACLARILENRKSLGLGHSADLIDD